VRVSHAIPHRRHNGVQFGDFLGVSGHGGIGYFFPVFRRFSNKTLSCAIRVRRAA
jgi:hypothetical protein